MKRSGKKLTVLRDGHPRRMADARNAWRKMSDDQRLDFIGWMLEWDGWSDPRVKAAVAGARLQQAQPAEAPEWQCADCENTEGLTTNEAVDVNTGQVFPDGNMGKPYCPRCDSECRLDETEGGNDDA